MKEEGNDNLVLAEARKGDSQGVGSLKQKIKSRVSLVKNRLRLPVNASVAATALNKYVEVSQKNPKLSHYGILQQLGAQKRDAVSTINSAIPIPMLVNAPDGQLRRALRDVLKEEPEQLNEQFNPPAMLVLKREAIRVFPNGQRVVMYTDNKYGLTFPVPYDYDKGFGVVNSMGKMQNNPAPKGYLNEETVPVIFATGDEIQVEKSTMEMISKVYDSLNEENKLRLQDMILESEETFNKVKQFAALIK